MGLDSPVYKRAFEDVARREEDFTSHLALLAAELDRQGQPGIAAIRGGNPGSLLRSRPVMLVNFACKTGRHAKAN